jgi:NitT/TauT family transport system substrate-binding protein
MAAYVGVDPVKDIHWVTTGWAKQVELFQSGAIDACLIFPSPETQFLRTQGIGHVVVNSTVDRPWSDYFCCMLNGNPEYVRNFPVATKRVMRAILKAADLCVTNPSEVARRLVDGGFTPRYDYALQDNRRAALRQMAGVRSRGHDAVLCPSAARRRHDQIEPQQNHCGKRGLAFLE